MQGKSLKKAIIQGTVTAFVFLASWFALSQVGWMQVLKVEDTKRNLEQKLGDIFTDVFRDSQDEVEDEFVKSTIDSLLSGICTRNDIEKSDIKVHIFESGEVNAFALPDGHMILNTGLILSAENQEELCGVICHELAHIESGHVMKKLIKEIGLNMLVSMTTGGGAETVRSAARMLSSTAYDRSLEAEADRIAAQYLIGAGIDAEPFASFLYTISEADKEAKALAWISTHPDSEERAKKILEYCSGQHTELSEIVSYSTWARFKEELSNAKSKM